MLDDTIKRIILVFLFFCIVISAVSAQDTVDQNVTCKTIEGQVHVSGAWIWFSLVVAAAIIYLIVRFGYIGLLNKADKHLLDVVYNTDNYPSLAKFQFLLWTFVIAWAFTWIWLMRLWGGQYGVPSFDIIPANILTLMGISVAVPITSGAIGSVKYQSLRQAGGKKKGVKHPLSTMLYEFEQPSLSRLQMLLWTFIGIFIYLITLYVFVISNLDTPACLALPDIDATIVVLMGLSQGAYVGGKLVATGQGPKISEIQPAKGIQGGEISIFGSGFGDKKDTVWIGSKGIREDKIKTWSDGRIDLEIPAETEAGSTQVKVGQGGQVSDVMDFVVDKKEEGGVTPTPPSPG
jgi:hypothetical protein